MSDLDDLITAFIAEEYQPARPAKDALVADADPQTSAHLAGLLHGWLDNDQRGEKPGSIAVSHALYVLGDRGDRIAIPTMLEIARRVHPTAEAANKVVFHCALLAMGAFVDDPAVQALLVEVLAMPAADLDEQNRFQKLIEGLTMKAPPDIVYDLLGSYARSEERRDIKRDKTLFALKQSAEAKRPIDRRWAPIAARMIEVELPGNAGPGMYAVTILAAAVQPDQADLLIDLASRQPLGASLLTALGKTRDRRGVPILERALGDSNAYVNAAAGAALRFFGDPELRERGLRAVTTQLAEYLASWEKAGDAVILCKALRAIDEPTIAAELEAHAKAVKKRGAKRVAEKEAKEHALEALQALLAHLQRDRA